MSSSLDMELLAEIRGNTNPPLLIDRSVLTDQLLRASITFILQFDRSYIRGPYSTGLARDGCELVGKYDKSAAVAFYRESSAERFKEFCSRSIVSRV